MAGRKIRGEEDARRCIAAVKASGLSRRKWARQRGVDGRSLFAWEKKLASDDAAGRRAKRGGLVELIPESRLPESRYLVQCGRFVVEIDEHFDEVTLGRLLKVVATC